MIRPGTGPNARLQRARKRAADAEYAVTRQQRFVQARWTCELCFVRVARATHHVQRRSQGVDHSVENLRALCHHCHEYIHRNVAWAKAERWLA